MAKRKLEDAIVTKEELEAALAEAEAALSGVIANLPASHVHFTSGPCYICAAGKAVEKAQAVKAQITALRAG